MPTLNDAIFEALSSPAADKAAAALNDYTRAVMAEGAAGHRALVRMRRDWGILQITRDTKAQQRRLRTLHIAVPNPANAREYKILTAWWTGKRR